MTAQRFGHDIAMMKDANINIFRVHIHIIKSFPESRLSYSLRNTRMLLETHTINIDIAADSGRQIKTLEWKNLPAGHYEIVAKVEDGSGNHLGINTHKFDVKR
ncbi:MAG: hypothetical protein PHD43_07280 [Methylococcales bacterium]|nr:hypothetical protein [Methylococcales bacterium]